ncbi:MAG: hypothetical protein HY434_01265 [Candidatus Liptonbacteria bacterium]|nr:hypothetical protein [Candidatus Liptonbacteria bacterium]
MKTLRIAFVVLVAVVVASCGPTYKSLMLDVCKKDNNTEQYCRDAYSWSFSPRVGIFTRETPDHKGYTVVTGLPTWDDVERQLKTLADNFNAMLDPKNVEEAQFLETFNLKESAERQERIVKLLDARVHVAKLDLRFREAMGQVSPMDMLDHRDGFNPKKVFTREDPGMMFPFNSDQIEEAKARGVLKPIERLPLQFDQELGKKVFPDPNDPNEFEWKKISRGMELTNFKIVDVAKPEDSLGNYIEGYVVTDGKKESKPALKIFFPTGGTAVVVIDSDREGSGIGYGLPEYVEQVAGVVSVAQVASGILTGDSLLGKVFEEKPQEQRVPPPVKKVYVEIAKAGEPLDPWEKAPTSTGWLVPFKYENDRRDNYNVKLKFKRPEHGNNPGEPIPDYLEIESVIREWTGANRYTPSTGAVVEYYRPKGDFEKKMQAEVMHQEDTKRIRFIFEDGHEETGRIAPGSNRFIEDKPYAIDYNEGQKRWHLEKSKGSDVFDKRKQISKPTEDKTGRYDVSEEDMAVTPSMRQKMNVAPSAEPKK